MPPLPPQAQVARPETLSTLTSAPESLVRTERHYSQIELFPVTRYAPDFTRTGGQIVQIELFPTVIHSSALSNLESRPLNHPLFLDIIRAMFWLKCMSLLNQKLLLYVVPHTVVEKLYYVASQEYVVWH